MRRDRVARWAELGYLIRVHRGVYAVGHLPTGSVERAHGALLAAGPRSALCGLSAAALWGLIDPWPATIELIGPLRRRIPGVRSELCTTLRRRDVQVVRGVRVTSPARTLLDVARRVGERRLERFHNELRMRRLVTNAQLIGVAQRNRAHPGVKLALALARASAGEPKRSQLELDWVAFAERYRLPAHAMNVPVAGFRVDVLFAGPPPLIVELDGYATHGTHRAYEADREREAQILAATGIPTVRVTHAALHSRSEQQAQRIRRILGRH